MGEDLATLRLRVEALTDSVTALSAVLVSDGTVRPFTLVALGEAHRREAAMAPHEDRGRIGVATADLADLILGMSGDQPLPRPVQLVHDASTRGIGPDATVDR